MEVKEYVAKHSLGKKITIKDKWGGYTSHDKASEVIITFTGEIDMDEANKITQTKAQELFDDESADPADGASWMKTEHEIPA